MRSRYCEQHCGMLRRVAYDERRVLHFDILEGKAVLHVLQSLVRPPAERQSVSTRSQTELIHVSMQHVLQ